MASRFRTYAEFWPFYLREHAKPSTRAVHYVGTIASAALLVWAVASQNWWLLLGVPLFGYGPAWFGHFFIEKNRPATFEAPFWSLSLIRSAGAACGAAPCSIVSMSPRTELGFACNVE